jgi:bifunctional DNA-binding transcriptional regulator/antitoxin component of YhaV-PrlF toxin-antitoxin module
MSVETIAEHVVVHDDGSISLSERLRDLAGIKAGDELLIRWLPPDEIIVRKGIAISDAEFDQEMNEFTQQLKNSGYDSKEKIVELVRAVKQEQAGEIVSGTQKR